MRVWLAHKKRGWKNDPDDGAVEVFATKAAAKALAKSWMQDLVDDMECDDHDETFMSELRASVKNFDVEAYGKATDLWIWLEQRRVRGAK